MLRLTQWMADYYLCNLGQALEADSCRPECGRRRERGGLRCCRWRAECRKRRLRRGGKLSKKQLGNRPLLVRQQRSRSNRGNWHARSNARMGPITALRRKGILRATTKRISAETAARAESAATANLELNADQQKALDAILEPLRAPRHETILIHGVTGSGKTEVYIQAIQEVISYGRQAIVLVPEISLTPQTRERFRARFDRVAVLHSHLRDAERHWHWERIARGEVQVVVGARSAVFAPVPHLGLIVLDEEHEGTFKQDSAPRYHARDVALWRAREEKVPLVLASATPSLESWYRAKQGEYRLVEMPRRVFDRPHAGGGDDRFAQRISQPAIARGGFAANAPGDRGGTARRRAGDFAAQSARIFDAHSMPGVRQRGAMPELRFAADASSHGQFGDVPLLRFSPADADRMPGVSCSRAFIFAAWARERLEAEMRARFPEASVLRMDTDAMQSHGSHDRALTQFRDGKVQILLGTQMIAKGLDFPNVTLVGVINADTALHLPDFRAAERTFQLVTQVAGRTGAARKEAACWCRRSVRSIRRFRRRCNTILERLPTRSCRCARRMVIRRWRRWCAWWCAENRKIKRAAFAQHLGDRLRAVRRNVSRRATGSGHSNAGAGGGAVCEVARAVSLSFAIARKRRRRNCGKLCGTRRPIWKCPTRLCGRPMWIRWICCERRVQGSVRQRASRGGIGLVWRSSAGRKMNRA